jgi:hypothetical protein
MTSPAQAVSRKAAEVARPRPVPGPLRPWVKPLARLGLTAKAVVYLTIGVLATKAAIGWGGRTTGTRGAMKELHAEGGALVPAFLGLGLLCYAAWRLVQAIADTERKGSGWKGLGGRSVYLGSGLVHLGLAASAVGMAIGSRSADDDGLSGWVATAMGSPVGELLVVIAGAVVMIVGVAQIVKAFKDDFTEKLERSRLSALRQRWVCRLGRFGHAARGVTFLIVGWFLVRAWLATDPGQARGIDGALRFLRAQENGDVFLGVVAVGVVAHGLYTLAEAWYRRVEPGPAR